MTMQRSLLMVLPWLGLSGATFAQDSQRVINEASELAKWCKAEAEARYVAKNIPTFQWTASHYSKGNALYAEGRLRVHGDDVVVKCRIARGAREEYGIVEIADPEL